MAIIKLSRENYFHNLSLLAERAGGVEKIAVVLKDNAYGHGLEEMAELAAEFGIKKAVVKDEAEAEKIVAHFPFVLLLLPRFTAHDPRFSYTINAIFHIKQMPQGAKVHLKIDSGMHRNGIDPEEIEEAFEEIEKRDLVLEGVMTHFRSADDLSADLFWQMDNWDRIKERVREIVVEKGIPLPIFHSFASSSLLRAKMRDDFARCGIATYGYSELDCVFEQADLRPVLKLYAHKVATRSLQQGNRIGYGGVYEVKADIVASTYDLGYGDGLFRYDGEGKLQIAGSPVLGRISMDSFSLEGVADEVEVLGDARYFASYFQTISYEVLTHLSPTLRRVIEK